MTSTEKPRREILVAPLAEAFKSSGRSPVEVARALDWYDHRGRPDTQRVMRSLGLRPVHFGRGYGPRCIRSTSYERALMLAHAIGIDPVDVGL